MFNRIAQRCSIQTLGAGPHQNHFQTQKICPQHPSLPKMRNNPIAGISSLDFKQPYHPLLNDVRTNDNFTVYIAALLEPPIQIIDYITNMWNCIWYGKTYSLVYALVNSILLSSLILGCAEFSKAIILYIQKKKDLVPNKVWLESRVCWIAS